MLILKVLNKTIKENTNNVFFIWLIALFYFMLSPIKIWNWDIILFNFEKVEIGIYVGLPLLIYLVATIFIEIKIRTSLIDVFLMIYILFLFIHAYILRPINLDDSFIIKNNLFLILYICFRNII